MAMVNLILLIVVFLGDTVGICKTLQTVENLLLAKALRLPAVSSFLFYFLLARLN